MSTSKASLPERDVVVIVLIGFVVALMAIPSQLIFKPLGAAGTPAQVLEVGMLAWWLSAQVLRRRAAPPNAVKFLVLGFALAILASYVAGMCRPQAYSSVVNSADRGLLSLAAWCGGILMLVDGVSSRANLDRILRAVAAGATGIAVLGMLQFFLKIDLASYLKIPGLTANHPYGELVARSQFSRVSGTTAHPIEFGVVLSSCLALTVHYARFAETKKSARRWWIAAAIVGISLPLSVARSAMLGGAIALMFMFKTWPPRMKLQMGAVLAIGAVGMSFAVPGLLGTITGLFLNAGNDPSTQGRTADYAPVIAEASKHPWFGQGFGTYIPNIFRTLDNMYLGLTVETGVIGLVAILSLYIGSLFVASGVRRRSTDERERNLAQSIKAGIAVGAINAATFDMLGFAMAAGISFLFIGAAGALRSLQADSMRPAASATGPSIRLTDRRARAPIALATAVPMIVMAAGGWAITSARPEYIALGTVVLTPAQQVGRPVFGGSDRAEYAASVLIDVMRHRAERDRLAALGADDYNVAADAASIERGSDVLGILSSTIHVVAWARYPTVADDALKTVIAEMASKFDQMQTDDGVDPSVQLHVHTVQTFAAYPIHGRRSRAAIGLLLIELMVFRTSLRVLRLYLARPVGAAPDEHPARRTGRFTRFKIAAEGGAG